MYEKVTSRTRLCVHRLSSFTFASPMTFTLQEGNLVKITVHCLIEDNNRGELHHNISIYKKITSRTRNAHRDRHTDRQMDGQTGGGTDCIPIIPYPKRKVRWDCL